MSIETLKQDLRDNVAHLNSIDPTAPALMGHLQNSLWPFLESLCEELDEMDESLEDVVHQSADVLHTDTAEVFAAIIAGGAVVAAELRKRVGNDAKLLAVIKEFNENLAQGREILAEITLPDAEGEEDSDGDGDGDQADDDNNDAADDAGEASPT